MEGVCINQGWRPTDKAAGPVIETPKNGDMAEETNTGPGSEALGDMLVSKRALRDEFSASRGDFDMSRFLDAVGPRLERVS